MAGQRYLEEEKDALYAALYRFHAVHHRHIKVRMQNLLATSRARIATASLLASHSQTLILETKEIVARMRAKLKGKSDGKTKGGGGSRTIFVSRVLWGMQAECSSRLSRV